VTRYTASRLFAMPTEAFSIQNSCQFASVRPHACATKRKLISEALGSAGSLRQQQQQHQVSSVASSLAAAVRPPQPSTVHVERVELNDGLRVPGDDASDSVRRKRSKKHEFEKWEHVKGMGSVNIVEGEQALSKNPAAITSSGQVH
jgi:hypothetical protein